MSYEEDMAKVMKRERGQGGRERGMEGWRLRCKGWRDVGMEECRDGRMAVEG